jgi:TPR repeat protein
MKQCAEFPLFQKTEKGDFAAFAELQRLAIGGNVEAMFMMGRLYDVPEKPHFKSDSGHARKWYETAAQRGHALAQLCIGNMYDYGDGGAQDDAKARQWYESAAKENVRDAQMHFARMLQTGRGGYQSSSEAAHWYGKAVERGDELAATNLALMHLNNQVEGASDTEAMRLFVFAAAKMDGVAHLMLGKMFLEGRGTAPHQRQALLFFCVAILLLPSGQNRDTAVLRKEQVLMHYPHYRQQVEKDALAYVKDGNGRIPFFKD